jgi:hypothetical protein
MLKCADCGEPVMPGREFPFEIDGVVRVYGCELRALHHAKVLEIEKIEKLYATIAAKREEMKEIEIQKELLRKEVGK